MSGLGARPFRRASRPSASTMASATRSNSTAAPRCARRSRRRFPHWAARLGDDHVLDLAALAADFRHRDDARRRDRACATTACPTPSCRAAICCSSPSPRRSPTGVASRLVGGMCETDYSGYPDCRDDTIKALQVALNLGMQRRFVVETPLMWIDKAATWRLARDSAARRWSTSSSRKPTPATGASAAAATTGATAAAHARPASCARTGTRRSAPPAEARRASFRRPAPSSLRRFRSG